MAQVEYGIRLSKCHMRLSRLLSSVLASAVLISGGADYGNGGSGGASGTFAITTTTAQFGVVGSIYSFTPATTGGTAPLTWSLFGGVLPAGLTLNATTGAVTGTPTTAGNSTATLRVVDSTGKSATGSVLFAMHTRTDRVSVDGSASAGNGVSSTPSINNDGSLIAFTSQATNFVTGVSGSQVYVHNRQTNQVELISRDNNTSVVNAGNGVTSASAISSDGRFVPFVSKATNLLAPGPPAIPAGQQIYIRDRQAGLTSLVSMDNNVASNPGNGFSSAPSINGDGSLVAFDSLATNLLAPGVPSVTGQQVYVRNRTSNQTSLVSADNNVAANPGNGVSRTASISSDGRFVAFISVGTNLLAPGIPSVTGQQIYVRDRQASQTSLVSQDNAGTNDAGNAPSDTPSTNSNGGFVAFSSQASDLVAAPSVAPPDIYVRALP